MSYGVGTFAAGDGKPFPGLVISDHVLDLRPTFGEHATVLSLLEDWDGSQERLEPLSAQPGPLTVSDLTVLPPVNPPGAYLCAGANYRRHVIEMRTANAARQGADAAAAAEAAAKEMDERAAHGTPFVWVGWPGAVIGANDDVIIPNDGGEQHDWELELAVVIGKFARCVSADDAIDYIAGYTILNDVSTRDRMHRSDVRFTDFMSTKLRPTFKPIGPWITPAKFVPDPEDLRITLKVNGETMQDDTTGDMVFKIPRLIEWASGIADLRPGDMIATGSPSGNAGEHGGNWLKPGDVMEGEITGLGIQRNECVAAKVRPQGPDFSSAFRPREV